MTKQDAINLLTQKDQLQLLSFYDTLTPAQQENLLAQIEGIDWSLLDVLKTHETVNARGTFAPLSAMELSQIDANRAHLEEVGLQAIREGKVAAVLLAGGQGTRLGFDKPKGMYNIGVTRELYIFECLINNVMEVVKKAGAWIPFYIMTSDKNYDDTTAFLKEKNYFGYNAEYIHFFKQDMAPSVDYNGKLLMEAPDRLSLSPNGNGGWFSSLCRYGYDKQMKEAGVEWLTAFAVDNVLQRINDPAFVGAVIDSGCDCGGMVVRKADPNERVGVLCTEDGKPSIVEYYEMTDDMIHLKDANGNLLYNFGVILNYMFNLDRLTEIKSKRLPLHIVEKKIPYIDGDGNMIKPTTPNGYKFESLILDMIHMMDSCCPFEVDREKAFAPVKNPTGVDSVESARKLLEKNGVTL